MSNDNISCAVAASITCGLLYSYASKKGLVASISDIITKTKEYAEGFIVSQTLPNALKYYHPLKYGRRPSL